MIAAVWTQQAQLKSPPVGVEELLGTLHRQDLAVTAARLRAEADRLGTLSRGFASCLGW
ncbi:hypothetical protein [Tautonia plasticadhaerens]|uniref:VapC50 C-terminal domain-containing protein n=1 Tax=Tautonia plasticadhaerens TaxID=2527974 RepID=A0A518HFC9_9BACT|nr:hypothetical protein [Tautonia plasticadhaerens]QDV39529.1 hypothetical protein ElP_74980 [Tautonia plasticadhaerens]QDV39555.1 hypothetical protein ElP_75260 [Tautonia plasticadhaerens]